MTLFQVLTPGYASPEQIKGEPITTAADVYSLGVVLYELLTGQHPHRVAGDAADKIARRVCDTEPKKPSSVVRGPKLPSRVLAWHRPTETRPKPLGWEKLSKRLIGDLDNIVLMALRKNRSGVMRQRNNSRRTSGDTLRTCPSARGKTL